MSLYAHTQFLKLGEPYGCTIKLQRCRGHGGGGGHPTFLNTAKKHRNSQTQSAYYERTFFTRRSNATFVYPLLVTGRHFESRGRRSVRALILVDIFFLKFFSKRINSMSMYRSRSSLNNNQCQLQVGVVERTIIVTNIRTHTYYFIV